MLFQVHTYVIRVELDQFNFNHFQIHLNDNGLTQIDQALLPWMQLDYVDIQNNPFRYGMK